MKNKQKRQSHLSETGVLVSLSMVPLQPRTDKSRQRDDLYSEGDF